MKADLSRITFQPERHYRTVLQQQGRVTIDADANEEAEIVNQRQDDTTADVIGRSGRPKGDFAVTLSTDPANITIGPGTLYVDGIPCVNDAACTLTTQPNLPLDDADLASFPDLIAGVGTYAVYLRAFERLVTSVEDPAIREKALGGADTAVRSQLVWQIRLVQMPALASGATCSTIGTTWQPAFSPGAMTAQTVPLAAAAANPCVLPPQAGFRSLENQLYRVEIHQGGPLTSATFKWSRENGSVLTAVVPTNPGDTQTAGPVLSVATVGRDANLGFGTEQYVELLDDRIELSGDFQPLSLTKIVTGALDQIELQAAATFPVDFSRSPKLRRWDQTTGDVNGIPLTAAAPIQLENGVAVSFADGDYRAGDYWLIPARTAIDEDTGNIEWPTDGSGNFLPQPSRYTEHTCLLTVVTWDGTSLSPALVTDSSFAAQCVPEFPPLTAIQASDVQYSPVCSDLAGTTNVAEALESLCMRQGPCTLVLHPVPGWEGAIAQLPAGSDAEICFTVGVFPPAQAGIVSISGLGHVKVSGAGLGTQLTNTAGRACLQFINCASVTVRDLSAVSGVVPLPQHDKYNGALDFRGCHSVTVESVYAECGGNTLLTSAGLYIGPQNNNDASVNGQTSLRVRGCTFVVGNAQYGILGVNIVRGQIEDNEIRAAAPPAAGSAAVAAPATTASLAPLIASRAHVLKVRTAPTAAAAVKENAATIAKPRVIAGIAGSARESVIPAGDSQVIFYSDPRVRSYVLRYMSTKVTPNLTPLQIAKQIGTLATTIAQDKTQWSSIPGLSQLSQAIVDATAPVGHRAICLAGSVLNEARIVNNTINGFRRGVHIALSHTETSRGAPDVADSVLIEGNRIVVSMIPNDGLPNGGNRKPSAPYAIYVGSVNNLLILNNQADVNVLTPESRAPAAVQVFGQIGARILVKGNFFNAFSAGLSLQYRSTATAPSNYLFIVADNVVSGAALLATSIPSTLTFTEATNLLAQSTI